jgi:hypothetical protein
MREIDTRSPLYDHGTRTNEDPVSELQCRHRKNRPKSKYRQHRDAYTMELLHCTNALLLLGRQSARITHPRHYACPLALAPAYLLVYQLPEARSATYICQLLRVGISTARRIIANHFDQSLVTNTNAYNVVTDRRGASAGAGHCFWCSMCACRDAWCSTAAEACSSACITCK